MPACTSFPARCGLAVLSGAAYALAYPPLGWGLLVVPGLAGLLVALRGQHGTHARTIGFMHGMAAYAVGLSWFHHVFVCATSGVSQVIDPHGYVHARLPALAQGPLIGTLRRESQLTFYTRWGWLTPWVVLGLSAVCWLGLLRPRASRVHEASLQDTDISTHPRNPAPCAGL